MRLFETLIFISFTAVVLAKRPHWYPENGQEIEAQCMDTHAVSEETMADLRNLIIKDTPAIRSLILCCLINTNVYRPGVGPEPDRIAVAFQQSIQRYCDMDLITGCTDAHKNVEPEEYAYFKVIKCIYDEAPKRCVLKKDDSEK